MSSQQVLVQARSVKINVSTLGYLLDSIELPPNSLHRMLPGGFVLDDYSELIQPVDAKVLDCLVMGSTPTPLLTLCMASKGVCRYFVFDPLDPNTRACLEHFSSAQALPFITWNGERATPCAVLAPMFEKGLERTRGRKPASRSEWLSQADTYAGTLPEIYARGLSCVASSSDHRVFIMVADQRLHDENGHKLQLPSAWTGSGI